MKYGQCFKICTHPPTITWNIPPPTAANKGRGTGDLNFLLPVPCAPSSYPLP